MAAKNFDDLPDNSRLWIFESDQQIEETQLGNLEQNLDSFLSTWAAHGSDLNAGWELRYDRFLMIAVDESKTSASGCSIDSLTRFMMNLGEALGVSFLDRSLVSHRFGDEIARTTRAGFTELAAAGSVTGDTVVFDNTLVSLGALRRGDWETPAAQSWHAALLN